jgi:hypothetical protein
MSSPDAHMLIDNVQECNYDEFSNDHVVIFIDHFLTMIFAFYIVNISCLNAIFKKVSQKPIISGGYLDCNKLFFVSSNLLSILFTLYEQILIPLVFLKPYILKVSFCLLLGVIKDIRKIAFKQERMESKFDETKNNLLQSKYPPDIIGFCETFFHQNISNDLFKIVSFKNRQPFL